MSKRRYRQPKTPATGSVFGSGQEMYNSMTDEIMKDGIDGTPEFPTAVQNGANRWQFNFTGVVQDVFAPMPSPNTFGYPAHRWRSYLDNYVGPEGVKNMRYRMRMGMAGQGDAMWNTHQKVYPVNMAPHNEKGNCFLGMSFRSTPVPSVTLISRTVMLTPMGVLDISFGILLARVFAKMLNSPTPPIFSWQVPSICVVPHFNTIMMLKRGMLDGLISFDPSVNSVRTPKRREKMGRDYNGSYSLELPPEFDDPEYPYTMLRNTVTRTKEFMETPDWNQPGDKPVYDQYRRMQQKVKKYLFAEEATKPWRPTLPDEWFEDLMGKSKKWAKNYKEDPLPPYPTMTKEDFPRGELIGNTAWSEAGAEERNYLK